MTQINEILTLNLHEDIKNVIDLEDQSELEIQQEMESYIVTRGLGNHFNSFFNRFTSNPKETGVWLSGFYGSGKSYFGKMLGYILANPLINGTRARDRFVPRLKGLADESLIENIIRRLDTVPTRVVFLDVAKQNTENGLAFTLFANLLKNLGFRQDIFGYMEFDLFIDGKYDEFCSKVFEIEGSEWKDLRNNNRLVARTMRNVYLAMNYSEKEYEETREVYAAAIKCFDAGKLRAELEKYLKKRTDETLVFIFDEASEAISQKKFTLLDLEGISEALSSVSKKVWTIAIAQEKLDDVINNTNVNRSQLSKVTDRFKTKIHLEATEVDVIIRSRLLQKKEKFFNQLVDYYKKNEGLVIDSTNLNSSFPTRTTSADEFAVYYPFHKYQFHILQKFLFSSNSLVATQIAARGMIITTFDVLRKQMRDMSLYSFTPAHAICTEAQTAPPVGLVNKYDTAGMILRKNNSEVDGEKLLKTIHLLADSDMVSATAENITKTYITDVSTYYDIKPKIEEALTQLVEAKVLLASNNSYKITSDLEGRMLEEMKDFSVELYSKKRSLINCLKDYKIFAPIATLSDNSESFKFSVTSDQEDELCSPGNKQLRLCVYSIFNVSENRQELIERLKTETQYQKDLITLVPDTSEFAQIDRLLAEIARYTYMESKYANESDPAKRQIIRDFSIIREEKEKDLRVRIENAYLRSSLVYIFDEYLLDPDSFKSTLTDLQKKLVRNIFTKRLPAQLSESLVPKIFSSRKEDLVRLFAGDDFRFFDANGNFVGDHLKVAEEINAKIKSRYVDGRGLESELSGAPWAYSFGTVVATLAALFRAGRLAVKYNGNNIFFDYKDKAVHEAFGNATKFKSAQFKAVTAALTASQKNQAVQALLDIEAEKYLERKVDWSINDFDLANVIHELAEHFIGSIATLGDTISGFDKLFPKIAGQKKVLQEFVGKVTEGNYIERVEFFLSHADELKSAVDNILKAQKFIKKNFDTVKKYQNFIDEVAAVLKKADCTEPDIEEARSEFSRLYREDMVKNLALLQQQAQIVKDSYFKLLKNAAARMTQEFQILAAKVDAACRRLKKDYPADLNKVNQKKLDDLGRYCNARVVETPEIEFTTACRRCGFTLADMLNYVALRANKENELQLIEIGFIPAPATPVGVAAGATEPGGQIKVRQLRKIQLQLPGKVMTVQEYREFLTCQIKAVAAAQPDEQIELDIVKAD